MCILHVRVSLYTNAIFKVENGYYISENILSRSWSLEITNDFSGSRATKVITMPKELHLFWYSIPIFYSFSFSFIYLIIYQT